MERCSIALFIFDDQAAVIIDLDSRRVIGPIVSDIFNFLSQHQTPAAVVGQVAPILQICSFPAEFLDDFRDQTISTDAGHRQRCRIGQIIRKFPGGDINPYTDNQTFRNASLKVGHGFHEDATDFFAVQIQIVDPFDFKVDIANLLHTGKQEYPLFQEGCLHLNLQVSGSHYGASMTRMSDFDLFILEQDADKLELQAMALAATELRSPLTSVMTIADRLFPLATQGDDPAAAETVAQLNRGLFQMLRIISNMSDAYRYCQDVVTRQEVRDVCSIMREIFLSAAPLVEHVGMHLDYLGPEESICCLVDYEKLERERAEEAASLEKEKQMQTAIIDIKKKYGKNAILKGMNLEEGATAKDRNAQIGGHKA